MPHAVTTRAPANAYRIDNLKNNERRLAAIDAGKNKMDISKLTDKELLQMLANAQTTYAEAGGHNKAYRNEVKANEYKEELKKRGVLIPDDRQLYEVGVFNGVGAC